MVPSAMPVRVDSRAWVRARTAHWWLEVEVGTVLGGEGRVTANTAPSSGIGLGGEGGGGVY